MTRNTFFCNHFCMAGSFDLWFFVLSQVNSSLSQQTHGNSCQPKMSSLKILEWWILNIFTEPKIHLCKFLIFITQNTTNCYFPCICCDRGWFTCDNKKDQRSNVPAKQKWLQKKVLRESDHGHGVPATNADRNPRLRSGTISHPK